MSRSGLPPAAESEVLRGIAGSPGVATGQVVVLGTSMESVPHRRVRSADIDAELLRFQKAVEDAQTELRDVAKKAEAEIGDDSILEAYVHMVGDPTLGKEVQRLIKNERRCAEWAVASAIARMASRLSAVDDAYLRERSHDVEFVGERLLLTLAGPERGRKIPKLTGPSVIVAHDLSPADTAAMLHEPVCAFVTEMGTRTSHTAILARALEIPCVVGVTGLFEKVEAGDRMIVDGLRGTATVRPSKDEEEAAEVRAQRHQALAQTLDKARDRKATTKDGAEIWLAANIELPEEAGAAVRHGAEGVGLYRTEFLYVDRDRLPSEQEQYEVFRRVIEAMNPRPITLRTFDIGGDKFASSFPVPPEMNPMLGLRAVRLALSRPGPFLEQLRAMVRASAHGEVKIMIPMVSGIKELRQARALLEQAKAEVKARGEPCADEIPLGVMIEVPSAAVMVEVFAREAAFLSIGTNDLIQYALAVDRTSRSMAYLASPFDPAVIRLIRGVVAAGRQHDCPVSLCGAMAGDPLAAIMLVGLGIRQFSMESAAIPEIKEVLGRVSRSEAEAIAHEALGLTTAEEVEHAFAEEFAPRLYDILSDPTR